MRMLCTDVYIKYGHFIVHKYGLLSLGNLIIYATCMYVNKYMSINTYAFVVACC